MQKIAAQFALDGAPTSVTPYGNGHINITYLVTTVSGRRYILQKIADHVFPDVDSLMENIAAVTRHIAQTDPDPRHVLTIVPTIGGKDFWEGGAQGPWRMYDFVEDSICLERVENADDFLQSGVAFGQFQNQLADFPAHTLHETIPRFHDTPNRYTQLYAAADADACGRLQEVGPEMAFVRAREEEAGSMVAMGKAGTLPLRVTHNDTKLNNVMLDNTTRKPLCVIDLDTVMPGLAANDFGDSIRFGASTAAEDEKDLDRVEMDLALYRVYTRGFLSACGDRLTQQEIDTLPLGAKLMTLECGIRFLADYLAGDVYFHTNYPTHNLDRARTQFKLVADMEQKWDEMQAIIKAEAGR